MTSCIGFARLHHDYCSSCHQTQLCTQIRKVNPLVAFKSDIYMLTRVYSVISQERLTMNLSSAPMEPDDTPTHYSTQSVPGHTRLKLYKKSTRICRELQRHQRVSVIELPVFHG